ncbi:MAG: CPBP family intramembrane metalloprotease [Candidatus Thorarchaeota archaeon]|nr:MAG: CPBP family intramembrane metalloprotease [Candidatus Thorarchaeota archaeon]
MQESKDKTLRDLVYFPVFFNIVALGVTGLSFTLLPGLMSDYAQMSFVIYAGVFLAEILLVLILVGRLRKAGMSIRGLLTFDRETRWLRAIAVFAALNVLFIAYIWVALWIGYITPFSGLNLFQVVFFILLLPLAAGIVEELAFRGYLIEVMLKKGLAENRVVLYSAISFAFIHGFFLVDKIIMTFLFGLIAGYYYVKERNLPVLIVAHIVVDVVTFGMTTIM